MKKNLLRFIAATSFSVLALNPYPTFAETLTEILSMAYENNLTLQNERLSLRSQDDSIITAISSQRPTVSLSTSISRSNTQKSTSSTTTPTSLTLSLSQTLYRGGRIRNGIKIAELNILSGRARLKSIEQQILFSAVNAYVNLLRDEAILQLRKSSENVLQNELNATRDRFKLGATTLTAVSQSESSVAAAAAARIQAEGQLNTSLSEFQKILGFSPNTLNLDTPDQLGYLPETLEQAIDIGLDENPSLIIAELSSIIADRNIDNAKAALLPTINLTASSRRTSDWVHWGNETKLNSIGLTISVPIYQGGKEYAAIRQAKESKSKGLIGIDTERRKIESGVSQAWFQLASSRAGIYARAEQVRASEVALDSVRQEEQVGSKTLLNVLNAEKDLLNARVALVTARRDEIIASYNLLSAMGRLTASSLGLDVELYDPEIHYNQIRSSWIGIN